MSKALSLIARPCCDKCVREAGALAYDVLELDKRVADLGDTCGYCGESLGDYIYVVIDYDECKEK